MDLWLEEPSARNPETGDLVFPTLTKQAFLLLVKFYDPAGGGTLRVRGPPPRRSSAGAARDSHCHMLFWSRGTAQALLLRRGGARSATCKPYLSLQTSVPMLCG